MSKPPAEDRNPRAPIYLILMFVAFGSAGCAAGAATLGSGLGSRTLSESLDALLAEPPFDGVHWGLLVADASSGRTMYERNPDLRFIPGSNMKLPLTAAAMGLLGSDYAWETAFFSTALPANGVLDANIYLPATGDPTLGEPFFESAEDALQALADSLLAAGVREVSGKLLIDVSAWDSTSVVDSWMIEDLPGRAGATGGAFVVQLGELEIRIQGAAQSGQDASVEWTPRGSDPASGVGLGSFVEHRVITVAEGVEAGLRARFLPESRRWIVEGEVMVGEVRILSLPSRDPVRLGVAALTRTLADRGVAIPNGTEIIWDQNLPLGTDCESGRIGSCDEMFRIAGMSSPPLNEVAAAILGPSQNWMAEQLVRTVGAERGEMGSWSEGFSALAEHLEAEAEVRPDAIHWEDGSGLSNHNLVSPRALVSILRYAGGQPWGSSFRSGLAQPGLEATTLDTRLPGLEGRVFAKTGTLSHVNSLSGYLVAADGRELVFSILSNGSNLPAARMRAVIDASVREIAGR